MPELETSHETVINEVNRFLREAKLSPAELARGAGISYHAARRLLYRGVKNRTNNAERVYRSLPGLRDKMQQSQLPAKEALYQACTVWWDGSVEHAKLIEALAQVTRNYRSSRSGPESPERDEDHTSRAE